MYDQAWLLLLELFAVAAAALGTVAVDMSLTVFAWALQPGPGLGRVGGNFGQPHRDQKHSACHTADGRLSMLTVWVPLVPVTVESGCMHVLPAECDPLLASPEDPRHMRPDADAALALGEPLPCEAGDALMWGSSTVHWGGPCSEEAAVPRKSIATMFMLPGADKSNSISEVELRRGLGLRERLRSISRSLVQYRSWYPDFAGLELPE